jgi:hypothetical protein
MMPMIFRVRQGPDLLRSEGAREEREIGETRGENSLPPKCGLPPSAQSVARVLSQSGAEQLPAGAPST